MSTFDAIILGVVQGVAEFLPISSSGHLILARELLGLQVPEGLAVDAVLQFATALAVVLYFRTDLWRLCISMWGGIRGRAMEQTERVLLWGIVLGTLPAIGAGLLLEEAMDTTFRSAELVAWVLIAGSGLFALAEYLPRVIRARTQRDACSIEEPPLRPLGTSPCKGEGDSASRLLTKGEFAPRPLPLIKGEAGRGWQWWHRPDITIGRGIAIGLFQCLALVPGMSRSGATISGGMLLGMSREAAARFAFLLSVPIIMGSGTKKLLELNAHGTPAGEWVMIVVAFAVAFASGVGTIHYLLRFLRTHTLWPFIWYRLALAAAVLLLV